MRLANSCTVMASGITTSRMTFLAAATLFLAELLLAQLFATRAGQPPGCAPAFLSSAPGLGDRQLAATPALFVARRAVPGASDDPWRSCGGILAIGPASAIVAPLRRRGGRSSTGASSSSSRRPRSSAFRRDSSSFARRSSSSAAALFGLLALDRGLALPRRDAPRPPRRACAALPASAACGPRRALGHGSRALRRQVLEHVRARASCGDASSSTAGSGFAGASALGAVWVRPRRGSFASTFSGSAAAERPGG